MVDPLDFIIDLIVADRTDTDQGLRDAVLLGTSVFAGETGVSFGNPDEPSSSEIIIESTKNTMAQQDITQIYPNEDDEEFLVKLKGRSYLEVAWISNADFKNRSY